MLQPTPKPAPDRDQTDSCRVIGTLCREAFPVFVYESALEEILEFSDSDQRREIGGFLVGDVHEDAGLYLEIRHFLPAHQTRSLAASLTFTHATWSAMTREVERRFEGQRVVGWHHTHPNLGVFLSAYDKFIHRHFFAQPWHVALVVDPCRGEFGFFQWHDGAIADCGFVCVRRKEATNTGGSPHAGRNAIGR